MKLIKAFNGCRFIGKFDNVPVVVGAQHKPICAVQNRLVIGFFNLWYTRVIVIFQNGVTFRTLIGYFVYLTCAMSQFRV